MSSKVIMPYAHQIWLKFLFKQELQEKVQDFETHSKKLVLNAFIGCLPATHRNLHVVETQWSSFHLSKKNLYLLKIRLEGPDVAFAWANTMRREMLAVNPAEVGFTSWTAYRACFLSSKLSFISSIFTQHKREYLTKEGPVFYTSHCLVGFEMHLLMDANMPPNAFPAWSQQIKDLGWPVPAPVYHWGKNIPQLFPWNLHWHLPPNTAELLRLSWSIYLNEDLDAMEESQKAHDVILNWVSQGVLSVFGPWATQSVPWRCSGPSMVTLEGGREVWVMEYKVTFTGFRKNAFYHWFRSNASSLIDSVIELDWPHYLAVTWSNPLALPPSPVKLGPQFLTCPIVKSKLSLVFNQRAEQVSTFPATLKWLKKEGFTLDPKAVTSYKIPPKDFFPEISKVVFRWPVPKSYVVGKQNVFQVIALMLGYLFKLAGFRATPKLIPRKRGIQTKDCLVLVLKNQAKTEFMRQGCAFLFPFLCEQKIKWFSNCLSFEWPKNLSGEWKDPLAAIVPFLKQIEEYPLEVQFFFASEAAFTVHDQRQKFLQKLQVKIRYGYRKLG